MTKFLIFIFCVLLMFSDAIAQANIWQPSPGHTQMPIWPGSIPDAQPVARPEDLTIQFYRKNNQLRFS